MICEVAVSQDLYGLEGKCERWMLQQYVRCTLGIKIFEKSSTRIPATNQFDRRMIVCITGRAYLFIIQ